MPESSGNIGKSERATQDRVIALFRDDLGYKHLGNWIDREDSRNIEVGLLTKALRKRGFTADKINRAIYKLQRDAGKQGRSLYHTNQAVYERLRYGVPVKVEAGRFRLRQSSKAR